MTEQDRASSGEFQAKITDSNVLDVLEATDSPVLSTQMIAEELPVTRQAVYERLQSLHESGEVERMKVGRSIVWWVDGNGE